ncbi:MAG: tetratricopeptide repeat protein [Planctomycetaceae bacterium]|nr:tetratricopeptide repeat protein [Planctomycetaceae bacterium]
MSGGHRSGGSFGGSNLGGSSGHRSGGSMGGSSGGRNFGSSGSGMQGGHRSSGGLNGGSHNHASPGVAGSSGRHSGGSQGLNGSGGGNHQNHGTQLGQRHTAGSQGGHNQFNNNGPNTHTAHYHGNGGHNGNWNGNGNGNWNGNGHNHGNWGNGWNGHGHNHHNHWNHGFWGGGFYPWWGPGYGWGGGYGYPFLGLGIGLGGWGYPYGGYGYGGYGGYGYDNWGYGSYGNYYNPYYSEPLVLGPTVIDYAQPLAQAAPPQTVTTEEAPAPDDNDPQTIAAMAEFDQARAAFKNGDYDGALAGVHRSLEKLPSDAVLHEFRGLVLFAQGNYPESAATVHAVLAGGPGWDWATMRDLYPNVETYTTQLRALEAYAVAHPESADARFLLGYQYMTEGYNDAAARQFQKAATLQPEDTLASQIVKSLTPPEAGTAQDVPLTAPITPVTPREPAVPEPPPAGIPVTSAGSTPVEPATVTAAKPSVEQLTGAWTASNADGANFSVDLKPDGTFKWDYTHDGKTGTLEGKYTLADDLLVLEPKDGQPMIGRVTESGADGFRFKMLGGPAEDQGLKFGK